MAAQETIVVVGAGIAGVTAAGTLRDSGFTGSRGSHMRGARSTLRSSLRSPRACSCTTSSSRWSRATCPTTLRFVHPENISLRPADWYEQQRIELRLGSCVVGIDSAAHRLTLQGGETLAYSRLILAPGARARRLPVVETGPVEVVYLRTLRDALELRRRLRPGRRVVLLGGGRHRHGRSRPARSCAIATLPSSSWHRGSWAGRSQKRSPSTLPRFIAARGSSYVLPAPLSAAYQREHRSRAAGWRRGSRGPARRRNRHRAERRAGAERRAPLRKMAIVVDEFGATRRARRLCRRVTRCAIRTSSLAARCAARTGCMRRTRRQPWRRTYSVPRSHMRTYHTCGPTLRSQDTGHGALRHGRARSRRGDVARNKFMLLYLSG
jgi:hypothetical protein